jgi:hypothetical protein
MQTTDTTSGDPRTDCFSLNEDVNRQLFYTRLQQVQGKDPKNIRHQVDEIFNHHFPHHAGFRYPHSSGGHQEKTCEMITPH